ncbi:MAG: cation:proton antiporter, partial [Candidatus Dojkabacteria bacterium]
DSVEITLTIILAHIVFIACEYMGVSGIIGVLASGLVLGNYGRTKISPKISHNMHQMWDFLVFVTTSIVFLLIGYEINLPSLWGNIEIVAITTGTLLLGRAISVYGIFGIYNIFVETSKKIPFKWMHVSNWGGLRGALPLIIILSIPSGHEEMRELFLQIVLGAILFTLVINALTIEPLIRFLQLNKLSCVNRVELKITELFVLQGLVRKLKKLRKINEIGEEAYKVNHDIVSEKLEKDKKLIEGWIEKKSAKYLNQMDKVLRRYCLIVERSTYYSLFKKGLLPEIVFNKLHQSFSEQLEKLDEGEEQFIASIDPVRYAAHAKVGSRSFRLTWFEQLLMKVDPYISLQDKLLSYNYKYHKARLLGDEKVLDELKEFAKDDLIPKKVLFGIMQLYQELMEHNRRTIDELVARHHDLCDRVDCQFVQLEANELIEEVLHEFGEQGRISPKALQTFQLKL